jgi:hypothetical protein
VVVIGAAVMLWLFAVVLLGPYHVPFQVPVQLLDQEPVGKPPVEGPPIDEAADVSGPAKLVLSNVTLESACVVDEI